MYTQVSKIRHILPSNALRLSLKDTNQRILLLALILITAMLGDMIVSSFFDVLGKKSGIIMLNHALYNTISCLIWNRTISSSGLMLTSKDLRKKLDLTVTYRIVVVLEYVVSLILILVLLQILLGRYFSVTLVSYITTTIIVGILTYSL